MYKPEGMDSIGMWIGNAFGNPRKTAVEFTVMTPSIAELSMF